MKRIKFFFIFFLLLTFCSKKKVESHRVARVFDTYLYLNEMPAIPNSIDSLIFIQNYANSWATKKLLLEKAEFNLTQDISYIDSLVNVYKESLFIHYYKEGVIQSYLDTVISDSLIKKYYHENIDNFKLKEDIVKLNYIKIRHIAPNINYVIDNYFSSNYKDMVGLEEYCLQFAERFFLGDVDWMNWSVFSKQLPIGGDFVYQDIKKVLKKKSKIELSDSTFRYFIYMQDFRLKGTSSPLEYVSSLIEKILINKRKKELINNIEKTLLEEALINNNFEVYE